jgi:carbonic anhydrase
MSFNWEPFGRTQREGPAAEPAPRASAPAPQLAVLTCMDARIDPLAALGLAAGEAFVLRNAGGVWTDDVARSLKLARGLGVTRVRVVAHTDCYAHGRDDEAAAAAAHETAARIRETGLEAEAEVLDLSVSRPAGARRPSG